MDSSVRKCLNPPTSGTSNKPLSKSQIKKLKRKGKKHEEASSPANQNLTDKSVDCKPDVKEYTTNENSKLTGIVNQQKEFVDNQSGAVEASNLPSNDDQKICNTNSELTSVGDTATTPEITIQDIKPDHIESDRTNIESTDEMKRAHKQSSNKTEEFCEPQPHASSSDTKRSREGQAAQNDRSRSGSRDSNARSSSTGSENGDKRKVELKDNKPDQGNRPTGSPKKHQKKSRWDDESGSQSQEPVDEHRALADKMKYIIQNPRLYQLDEYDEVVIVVTAFNRFVHAVHRTGYVYLSGLATTLSQTENFVRGIAQKYDSEFEYFVDGDRQTNIRVRRSRRRGEDDPDFILSKKLSGLLRHRAEDKGFKLLDGGFLFVEDILRRNEFKRFKEEDVKRIVKDNDKQRFGLSVDDKTGKLKIRANQGHSMKIDNLELHSVSGKEVPTCVHGTNYTAWEFIKQSGLKTMGRNHIHFAPGEPGSSGVISGMRGSCQVLVFVDMDKAIADGIKFEMSANKVILSEGNRSNAIPTKYFSKVIDRQSRKQLPYGVGSGTREKSAPQSSAKSTDKKPTAKTHAQ